MMKTHFEKFGTGYIVAGDGRYVDRSEGFKAIWTGLEGRQWEVDVVYRHRQVVAA
jgi:hypothetical protein